jgi:glycosyltransferase involved in cell wall biosynthesis
MATILLVRGHLVTPWELRPWSDLPKRFEVRYMQTTSNNFDTGSVAISSVSVGTLRDRLPRGRVGEVLTGLIGDRYTDRADDAYSQADVVHAEELSFWFAADAARRKERHGYKLVQTVWETLPFLHTYRNRHARKFRDQVLAATDLFLPATDRARHALLLEGVPEEKIIVCSPGIDTERFAARTWRDASVSVPAEHTILSPGRLVWEKGHQDALRAVALLHRGIVTLADGASVKPRLHIVGSGPEGPRLRAYAEELGLVKHVTFDSVPYSEMPKVFARASCLMLGSQGAAQAFYHLFDRPHAFWEEQFGLVFAEAMAAGLDIITTTSGAIPEVLAGVGTLVPPGDWLGMAQALAAGPLARTPGERVEYPPGVIEHYSTGAMAGRLAAAYDRVMNANS